MADPQALHDLDKTAIAFIEIRQVVPVIPIHDKRIEIAIIVYISKRRSIGGCIVLHDGIIGHRYKTARLVIEVKHIVLPVLRTIRNKAIYKSIVVDIYPIDTP